MRNCKRCGVQKPLEQFPKNSKCADGRTHICNVCAALYRSQHRDHYKALNAANQRRPEVKAQAAERNKAWRKRHPDRVKAERAVERAVKSGVLVPTPCIACGERAVAHHPDYSRPLDVVWLCRQHHHEVHQMAKG